MRRVGRIGNRAPFRSDERVPRAEIAGIQTRSPDPRQEIKGGNQIAEIFASYA